MKKQQFLQTIIAEANQGDVIPLLGLLDHCQDRGLSLYRVIKFAVRTLKIPFPIVRKNLITIYSIYLLPPS